ncbi:hypothetical protein IJH24_03510 [Candidatus Saccharibacteria bacterium]|nr:hypothetical protein [Candidatus Saccharibacteria bacterium]
MTRVSKVAGVPLEDDEAIAFADWLRAQHIPHTHIANEIGGSTKTAKLRALKAKRMGQTAGVWDYEIFLPIINVFGDVDAYQEVRVELKRTKGSTTSPAQKEWGKVYELAGIPCAVCKGAEAAINFVNKVKREIEGLDD